MFLLQGLISSSEEDTSDAITECEHSVHNGHVALLQGFALQSKYVQYVYILYIYMYMCVHIHVHVYLYLCSSLGICMNMTCTTTCMYIYIYIHRSEKQEGRGIDKKY